MWPWAGNRRLYSLGLGPTAPTWQTLDADTQEGGQRQEGTSGQRRESQPLGGAEPLTSRRETHERAAEEDPTKCGLPQTAVGPHLSLRPDRYPVLRVYEVCCDFLLKARVI